MPLVLKAREIAGSAKLSTVLSTATRRTGSIKTARAVHSRRPARWVTVSMVGLSESGKSVLLYRLDGLPAKRQFRGRGES